MADEADGFDPLPRGFAEPRGTAGRRGGVRGEEGPRSVVIVLPGIMGSHLQVGSDRVWFDPLDVARGGLKKIEYEQENLNKVSAEKLFEMFYGDLCEHLARTHRVIRYAYDWRRPVQHAAEGLARERRIALAATAADAAAGANPRAQHGRPGDARDGGGRARTLEGLPCA